MLYKTLSQKHSDYDAGLLQELDDLYVGGYQIAERAKHYLPQLADESREYYDERVKLTAYLPYFGQIVDAFTADVFSQDVAVTAAADAEDESTVGTTPDDAFYGTLAADVDRKGSPLSKLLRGVLASATIKRRAFVAGHQLANRRVRSPSLGRASPMRVRASRPRC